MKLARWALVMLAVIPATVLVGWITYNVYLMRVVPSFTPMNPVTASCFLLTAVALTAYVIKLRYGQRCCQVVGALLMAVGLAMLCHYIFNVDSHIDQILFHGTLHGNRIAPNTAFNLTLIGFALLSIKARRSLIGVIAITSFISTLSIIGYLYGLKQLFGISNFNPMAIHTAVCFLLVDVVLLSILVGKVRLYIDRKIIVTLLFVMVAVIGVNMVTVQVSKDAEKYEEHVERTHKIITATNEVELSLANVETGQRGFLLTGKTSYLEPYETAKSIIFSQADILYALMAQDNKGVGTSRRINDLITQKIAELDATVQLRKNNDTTGALRIVNSDKGKQYADDTRGLLEEIERAQMSELASLQKTAANRRQDALWVVSIATAIDIVLVIGTSLFIQRSIKRRISAEKDLSRTLAELRVSKAKDDALLSSIGDAVFAIDTKQRITLFNPATARMSGFSAAEALGRPYNEVLIFEHEQTGKASTKFIEQALAGQAASMEGHTVLVQKNGTKISVADSAAPVVDAEGNVQGVIVVFRDTTKERELDKAKTEFVSLASHQLRTPLSAINWYGEMLLNGDAGKLQKEQKAYTQEIYDGTQRMIELVNALLDATRLEVGKMIARPEPTSVNDIVGSLEKELALSIKAKRLTLVHHIETLPAVVADPKQLRMVVQNLLSNAVKYTPAKGSVTVTLRKATPDDMHAAALRGNAAAHWYFSVQDTGYGIPETEQSKIFSKLYRADNVQRLEVEGTGLGLYIVKEIVEKMGGKVWFASAENQGSTFYVVLPFASETA